MPSLVPAALVLLSQLAVQSAPPAAPAGGDRAEPAPAGPRVVPTVRLDPEHPYPIKGWWSNGEQMLEVAEDGAYRFYDSTNRYRKPAEVGRWHRQNHAAFWLEPYTMRKDDRTRVPLSLVDDRVIIQVRNLKAMSFLPEPPMVAEDLFIGIWSGPGGSLELQSTMRYHYVAPRAAAEGQPVVISSHRGDWRLRDGHVELLPDSPSVTAMILEPGTIDVGEGTKPSKAPANPAKEAKQDGAKDAGTAAGSAEDESPTFNVLHGVEGDLLRVVERPAVGPRDGQREGQHDTGDKVAPAATPDAGKPEAARPVATRPEATRPAAG